MKTLLVIPVLLGSVVAFFPAAAPAQPAPPGSDVYLASLSLEGNPVSVGRPRNITSRPGYDNQPFFAPDEAFILFTSADTSGATDIFRYDLAGGKTVQVTHTGESEYSPTVIKGTPCFSTVRVEADGAQRLWRFDLDGGNPRLVLAAVDSVGYHAWVNETTLGLFILGEPHTLRLADVPTDSDRVVARNIGRCLHTVPGTEEISFVHVANEDESWISVFDPVSNEVRRLVATLPGRQDFVWTPDGDIIMADGSVLFLWAGDGEWEEIAALGAYGIENITRLAVSPTGRWLALVADDS